MGMGPPHHADNSLDVRYRMLEIERRCAVWRCEEYRRLLEQFSGGVGQAASPAEPEGGQQPIATSSAASQSVPATPSGHTLLQQRPLPSPMARQDDDDGGERRRRTGRTELEPPETAVRRRGDEESFVGCVAALCANNSHRSRTAIFGAAGLRDYQLAPEEAVCASNTPEMPWKTFCRTFGGWLHAERPMGKRVPGYDTGNFVCANKTAQPFAPKRIGEPGVILFSPGTALLEDTKDTFHVLVDLSLRTKTKLRYCGIYTKVHAPYMEVQVDEWYKLTKQCRRELLERFRRLKVGDVHARCSLRKRLGSDPSPAEIREWIQKYHRGTEVMEYKALRTAFDSGTEKFGFEVIKCVGYDTKLAKLIRQETNRQSYAHYNV